MDMLSSLIVTAISRVTVYASFYRQAFTRYINKTPLAGTSLSTISAKYIPCPAENGEEVVPLPALNESIIVYCYCDLIVIQS